ncbi:helix-turn-helix transcriptional regulator [Nonomuraea sp. MG754425]|uniref:helix-turn-helix transcriptional regulator n=1 Tax=Nonomuraea sp. MG754425 TaxID=2570319 RepID=UPI001F1E06B1|nr:helix-turn-helix transcriptional regulator [Nonomuraea sp. MG754425]MCF6470643.1 helix-turn-helix transcriptional regulator [Nonomuraea sp. MG754425]
MEHLGDRLASLRRLADLTQEELAELSGVSVDVVRKLEQRRKHSARLPTLHALAKGLGTEVSALVGDPPAVPSNGHAESPQLVALRRAIMPPLFAPPPERDAAESLSLPLLRSEISEGWTLYHSAEFDRLADVLPGMIEDARLIASIGSPEQRAQGEGSLSKALQLAGHLAIRLGKTDLALSSLERAAMAAQNSGDPLFAPMVYGSVAWAYQRQNRLDDAEHLAERAADAVERETGMKTAAGLRVWGGLVMSAATSAARSGSYDRATEMMTTAEQWAKRLSSLPPVEDSRAVSVFNRSSVRIERVRLAVQHARPDEALHLAKGLRLSGDVPPSWRTWFLLDVARAYTDLGDASSAVRTLEALKGAAPGWMRHHVLAVTIIRDLYAGPIQPPGLRKLAEYVGVRP